MPAYLCEKGSSHTVLTESLACEAGGCYATGWLQWLTNHQDGGQVPIVHSALMPLMVGTKSEVLHELYPLLKKTHIVH